MALKYDLITLFSFEFNTHALYVFYAVAILIGMSKTGVHGAGMMAVPLLASIFGGRFSSGILLPMLVFADLFGVKYYSQHASWKHLRLLFPWAAVGVILGTVTGIYINDEVFKIIMASVIIVSILVMIWLQRGHKEDIPDYTWFAVLIGVTGGFTSMVGNLAGTVMAVYLLAMRLPKNSYIGTTAWFFMVTNWFKVPFHVFMWKTISLDTFLLDLTAVPAIAVGAYLGIIIVRKIPDYLYRWFIIVTTLIAAAFMFL